MVPGHFPICLRNFSKRNEQYSFNRYLLITCHVFTTVLDDEEYGFLQDGESLWFHRGYFALFPQWQTGHCYWSIKAIMRGFLGHRALSANTEAVLDHLGWLITLSYHQGFSPWLLFTWSSSKGFIFTEQLSETGQWVNCCLMSLYMRKKTFPKATWQDSPFISLAGVMS